MTVPVRNRRLWRPRSRSVATNEGILSSMSMYSYQVAFFFFSSSGVNGWRRTNVNPTRPPLSKRLEQINW